MSRHDNPQDNNKKIILDPYIRAWFDPRRSWHKQKVRVQAETCWIADGSKAGIDIFLADGDGNATGSAIESAEGKIIKGRLVGEDGKNGVEHALEWTLPSDVDKAIGLIASVKVPDYKVETNSSFAGAGFIALCDFRMKR